MATIMSFGQTGVNSKMALKNAVYIQKSQELLQKAPKTPDGHVRCMTAESEKLKRELNPNLPSKQDFENWIAKKIKELPYNPNYGIKATRNIPVVVHILYGNATQNVSTAQVISQITALNKDYSATNSDIGSVPSAFTSVIGNMDIQFCLATVDPTGNPTNGIDRISIPVTSISATDIETNYGLNNMWDPTKYFNIFVGNITGGLLGKAVFPTGSGLAGLGTGGAPAYDGIMIAYTAFGTTGTAQAPYNKGRSATHESGHWLGLRHIGGDGTCATDYVADTPTQKGGYAGGQFGQNYGCPPYPYTAASECTGTTAEMTMNYMDYTDDPCMYMFSAGQKLRMDAVLLNSPHRKELLTSTVCGVAATNDAGISAITTPSGAYCTTTITPVVVLKNFGSSALTSVTINYQVDATTVQTFNWTGNLATNATANVTLAAITVAGGSHTFNANTSSPNGSTDGNTANDAASSSFTVSSTGLALPFAEGFEGTTFIPAGWTLNNPDGATTWARTTAAASTGTASAYMDYFNYSAGNEFDEMVTPSLDLTTKTAPQLTFQVAYQLYTDPTSTPPVYSDTLDVLISTDCGATYTSLYRKSSTQLTTTTPTFSTTQFVPNPNQWRLETVDLSAYGTYNNAIIMFRGINGYENELYLDDINVTGGIVTSVNELNNGVITESPNPTKDVINITFPVNEGNEVSVYNLVGELIYANNNLNNSTLAIDMRKQANGIYFVKIKSGNQVVTKKVILSK